MIKLYHGSYTEVSTPRVDAGRRNLDFGKGFYHQICIRNQEIIDKHLHFHTSYTIKDEE